MSEYRLYHGDCLEILPRLIEEGVRVDAVITDPPYCSGGRQQQGARNQIEKSTRLPDEWFLADNMGTDTYIRFMRMVALACLNIVHMGGHAYVFTDWRQYTNLVTAFESVGWTLRNVIVWDKARGGAMGSFWRNNHEWIAVFSKGKPMPLRHRSCYNTWRGTKPQGGLHPTEKPVELIRYIINAVPGDVIADPFMGSGTTGVACLVEQRDFIGIERDADYFCVARDRIEEAARQPLLLQGAEQREAEQQAPLPLDML